MASSAVREELRCSICLSVYTDPVMLPCGHNFCRACMAEVLDSQRNRGPYSCPDCRAEFTKRPKLQKNMKLHNIAEHLRSAPAQPDTARAFCTYCIQSPAPAVRTCLLCEASLCDDHLRVHSTSVEHVLVGPTASTRNRKCPEHKKVLEYYCYGDKACVCVYCTLGNEHRGHQMAPLVEASGVKKENLKQILVTLTAKSESVSDQIRQLESAMAELERKKRHVSELCEASDPLTVLEERESETRDYCYVPEIDKNNLQRDEQKYWTNTQFVLLLLCLCLAFIFSEKKQ